jgi:hypothetical protein
VVEEARVNINELVLNRTSVNTNSIKPDVNPAALKEQTNLLCLTLMSVATISSTPTLLSVETCLKNAKKTLESTGVQRVGIDNNWLCSSSKIILVALFLVVNFKDSTQALALFNIPKQQVFVFRYQNV